MVKRLVSNLLGIPVYEEVNLLPGHLWFGHPSPLEKEWQAIVDAVQAWGDVYEDKDVKDVDTMEVVRAMHGVCDALDAYTVSRRDDG